MKRRTQYMKWGLTAFLTVCAVLVFYDTFYMGGTLQRFVSKLFSVLAPVLYGCVIAYLLTPVMNWIERTLRRGWQKLFPQKHLKTPPASCASSASCWRRPWPFCWCIC